MVAIKWEKNPLLVADGRNVVVGATWMETIKWRRNVFLAGDGRNMLVNNTLKQFHCALDPRLSSE